MNDLYVGVDVHERESQVAVFSDTGTLMQEGRMPTAELSKYISSLGGGDMRKHIAIESVGFIYPIYDELKKGKDCTVSVAAPSRLQLIARSKLKSDRVDAS